MNKITVYIADREDGGIRVWSDDLPGLILSGKNRVGVLADIGPAVKAIRAYKGLTDEVQIDAVFERIGHG